jgi:hypothetical protein
VPRPQLTWWLIGNRHYGMHVVDARTSKEAKAEVRERIAQTFLGEGLAPSAAQRAASSYGVFVVAGRLTEREAREAQRAWDAWDNGPAEKLRRRYRRGL